MTQPLHRSPLMPVVRLQLAQFIIPALAVIVAIAMAWLAYQSSIPAVSHKDVRNIQTIIGATGLLASVAWLLFSWVPGNGSQRDIAVPWAIVCLMVTVGSAMGGFDPALHAVQWSVIQSFIFVALPFIIGLTMLTRLYAPTDLCSSSSAMGFCGGCFTLLALAPLAVTGDTASTLVLSGLAIGTSMAVCRLTLCHLIKW
jgi:hypothetical protein